MTTYRTLLLVCICSLAACGDSGSGTPTVDRGGGSADAGTGGVDAGTDDVGASDAGGGGGGGTDASVDVGGGTMDTGGGGGVDTGSPIDTGGGTMDTGGGTMDTGGGTTDTAPDVPMGSVDPYAPGPYGVNEASETFSGPGREYELLLFLPDDGADAPYPVVIFNHGFQLAGSDYASYGRHFASHGYIAILPSFGDSLFSPLTHTELATETVALLSWIEFEADNPGSRLFGLADATQIAGTGHSRGGKQTILAATTDDRIDVLFLIDPVDSGPPFGGNETDYPSVAPERMGDVVVPTGFVGAGRGGESMLGQSCAPTDDNYHQYFSAAGSPSFEYVVTEAGHLDFTDSCGGICFTCPGGDDTVDAFARGFAQATAVAFIKVFLEGDERFRPWVDGAEVTGVSGVTFTANP